MIQRFCLYGALLFGAALSGSAFEIPERTTQVSDGRIVFPVADAKSTGDGLRVWSYKPTRWGMYDIEFLFPAEGKLPDATELEIAGQKFPAKFESARAVDESRVVSSGRFYLAKSEPFEVSTRTGKRGEAAELLAVQLRPAPEGPAIIQSADQIVLPSSNAITHSVLMRYEPATNKNCLGYWANPADSAEWRFTVKQPGAYEIELWQGCGKGQGGSDVLVQVIREGVPIKEARFVVQETGHFQTFIPRTLGAVSFSEPGEYSLWVRPQRKQAGAVMDIRQIVLHPTETNEPAPGEPEAGVRSLRSLTGKRVLFLGDSITYAGEYIEFLETFVRLEHPGAKVDFLNLGLPSETVSGLSEPGHAGGQFPRPDLHERLDRVLQKTKPNLVFACYGMNDGIYHPYAEERFKKFQEGILRLRERAEAVGAKVIHITPPTFDPVPLKGRTLPAGRPEYRSPYQGYNEVLDRYADWLVGQRAQGWRVIDAHTTMNQFLDEQRKAKPEFLLAGDGVHVNSQGHWIITREILRHFLALSSLTNADDPSALLTSAPRAEEIHKLVQQRQRLLKDAWLTDTGHKRPGMSKGRPLNEAEREASTILRKLEPERKRLSATLEWPGKRSIWHGFERFDFEVDGRPVLVVVPKIEAPGRPWLWHGEFFGHKPNPDLALLGRGCHIVYMSVPDMLGGPPAVAHWNALHQELTSRYGFAPRPALVGLSRGGLYCYNWAAANPDKVACIYGDAPVCDFKSWPGAFGKGKRSDRDWQLVLEQYGFKSDEEAKAYAKNPVDNLAPLAAARVPLLHVFGDADEVVPWDENTGLVAERYKQLGGDIELIRKPGVKHHPHGLDDSTPIVDFIWQHTASSEAKQWLARHGGGPLDAQERPLIRKLGTIDLDLVETIPVVISNRVWRFEWVRQGLGQQYWDNKRSTNYFRFRDPATGEITAPFADGHEFGSAFVHDGVVYVTGTHSRNRINMFASRDLKQWETWSVLNDPRYGIFNTSLCRTDDGFVLMFEIDKPKEEAGAAFTARFLKSPDLRKWKLTPPECNYAKDRYTAPHALRWLDGWFYNFYLEAYQGYEMRVVRSRDLVQWEPSPLNPVLRHSPEDKIIANPALTDAQRTRIASATNLNNSDIDFCEWQGRLLINYSWGNQQGIEHLAEAVHDGSLAQFLKGWFPEK